MNYEIIGDIVTFLIVGIVFIAVIAILFRITLKNYNVRSGKIKFYGMFLGMDNRSILAFSLITLNSVFLIWWTSCFTGLNVYYVVITVVLMLLADIMIKDYGRIPTDLIFSMINMLCIFVTSMLYNYLNNQYSSVFLLIILGLVTLFVFLYFTYMPFKLLNNVIIREENLKKKNYKEL